MSDEIIYLHDELEGITKEITKTIKEIEKKKLKPEAKSEKIHHVQDRVQRGKDIYSNFRVELRDVLKEQGRVAFAEWEGKGHQHHKNITKLTKDVEVLLKKQAEEEAKAKDGPQKRDNKDVNTWSSNEVITEGKKVQGQSAAALSRSQKLVEMSEEVGTGTSVNLKTQTEQMKNTNADVVGVDQSLYRADKLIKQIMRRLATDKIIVCMLLILILAILGVIIAKSANLIPGTGGKTDGAAIDCNLDITQTNKQCKEKQAEAAAAAAGTTTVKPGGRRGPSSNKGGGVRARQGQQALARVVSRRGTDSEATLVMPAANSLGGVVAARSSQGRAEHGAGWIASVERAVEEWLRHVLW